MRQSLLGDRFYYGDTTGQASNIRIEAFPYLGLTALIGYGHAVYATRDMETGYTVYYEGWYSRSPSTRCQLTKLGLSANSDQIGVDEVSDERKSRGDFRRADKRAERGELGVEV